LRIDRSCSAEYDTGLQICASLNYKDLLPLLANHFYYNLPNRIFAIVFLCISLVPSTISSTRASR